MLLLLMMAFVYLQVCNGFIELVTERGNNDREFRLTCRRLSSHIAIMEASFAPANNMSENHINRTLLELTGLTPGQYHIRLSLNQRCSGRNHCSFILATDCPGAIFWGPGEVFIKYACMPEEYVTRFCNMNVSIPAGGGSNAQGFFTTPGYPKFYVGQSVCRWQITAPTNQRVEILLLDVSLSGGYGPDSPDGPCEDDVTVIDSGLELVKTCTEYDEAPIVLSESNNVQVTVVGRSGSLVAKRGVLIYYRAIECPTLAPPIDGYLVHRNATAAVYMCCVGFLFPDTLQRTRILHCLQNAWDFNLPSECILQPNVSFSTKEVKNRRDKMSENSHMIDIVIPSILIAGLLFGNAIIVFIIYKYRKRKTTDMNEEELNTMVANTSNVP